MIFFSNQMTIPCGDSGPTSSTAVSRGVPLRWLASGKQRNLPTRGPGVSICFKQCIIIIIQIWKINCFDIVQLESKNKTENQWISWHLNPRVARNYLHGQHDIWNDVGEGPWSEWDYNRPAGCGHEKSMSMSRRCNETQNVLECDGDLLIM